MGRTHDKQHGAGDDVAMTLRAHGVYPTTQRLFVASVLLSRHQHLTADELHERLFLEGMQVSKATVYNTLKLFTDQGLVREVVIDGGRTLYDSNAAHHAHLYNVDTGELIDIPAPTDPPLRDLPLPPGTRVESVDVVVRITSASD
jgi:Fur family iron response transcriptional regulator